MHNWKVYTTCYNFKFRVELETEGLFQTTGSQVNSQSDNSLCCAVDPCDAGLSTPVSPAARGGSLCCEVDSYDADLSTRVSSAARGGPLWSVVDSCDAGLSTPVLPAARGGPLCAVHHVSTWIAAVLHGQLLQLSCRRRLVPGLRDHLYHCLYSCQQRRPTYRFTSLHQHRCIQGEVMSQSSTGHGAIDILWVINQSINQREICRAPLYDTPRSAKSSQW